MSEREQIVAWLRAAFKDGWPDVRLGAHLAANAIERGDHLRMPKP